MFAIYEDNISASLRPHVAKANGTRFLYLHEFDRFDDPNGTQIPYLMKKASDIYCLMQIAHSSSVSFVKSADLSEITHLTSVSSPHSHPHPHLYPAHAPRTHSPHRSRPSLRPAPRSRSAPHPHSHPHPAPPAVPAPNSPPRSRTRTCSPLTLPAPAPRSRPAPPTTLHPTPP